MGQVFIDASLDEVDLEVLRDRRQIAGDGIVVPVVAVDREGGMLNAAPEIATCGFLSGSEGGEILEEASRALAESLAEASDEERTDEGVLKAKIQADLKRFLKRRTQRRPLIVPVIVEL